MQIITKQQIIYFFQVSLNTFGYVNQVSLPVLIHHSSLFFSMHGEPGHTFDRILYDSVLYCFRALFVFDFITFFFKSTLLK